TPCPALHESSPPVSLSTFVERGDAGRVGMAGRGLGAASELPRACARGQCYRYRRSSRLITPAPVPVTASAVGASKTSLRLSSFAISSPNTSQNRLDNLAVTGTRPPPVGRARMCGGVGDPA